MTLRAPVGQKPGPWRRTAVEVRTDAAFIERVIALRIGREKRREEN